LSRAEKSDLNFENIAAVATGALAANAITGLLKSNDSNSKNHVGSARYSSQEDSFLQDYTFGVEGNITLKN
jgi:hypothetical protein